MEPSIACIHMHERKTGNNELASKVQNTRFKENEYTDRRVPVHVVMAEL